MTQADAALTGAERLTGPERPQVLADLTRDRRELRAAVRRVLGELDIKHQAPEESRDDGVVRLQGSWTGDRIVLWAAGCPGPPTDHQGLALLLKEADAPSTGWVDHPGVALGSGRLAPAVAAPVGGVLGWLVGVGAGQLAPEMAPSLRWLGRVAVWGTELVAQGRMVPTLVCPATAANSGRGATAVYAVRWAPAVVDGWRLAQLSSRMPGAVSALDRSASAKLVCRAVLAAVVDTVCRAGAARLVSPATVPIARSPAEVSEAVLAGFDGRPFTASMRPAAETAVDLERWAAPVTGEPAVGLTVRLDPPDPGGAWLLRVEATVPGRGRLPVHQAEAEPPARRREIEGALRRLERLLPPLRRASGCRGQVVLGVDEAWDLMTTTGPVLIAAGFDVAVPAFSGRRPAPRLALHAEPAGGPSQVGAQQLCGVRWSVLIDDQELDAAAVARLAAQARPLLRVAGGWVELDRADLVAAAMALAERATTTQLPGAAILRLAMGLEGAPVAVGGQGWAAELLQGATDRPEPLPAPGGFAGELRTYQAEARGWLAFLDRSGLGGCLALDMGLGKTPVVLAHLLDSKGDGPTLVVAPSAVLGNWAAEAARFTPGLRVHIHHGSQRCSGGELASIAVGADVVLTTYATAARDVDALATVDWRWLVVDEAQMIKNAASFTAQELRRISARSRLALTGTPVENGLGDLWAILDFVNPGLVGSRPAFVAGLTGKAGLAGKGNGVRTATEGALRALNGLLVFRRTKAEPEIAAELPDKIDELDHCGMTLEQVGLYQAVLDRLLAGELLDSERDARKGHVLAAITALKQICDHPAAYLKDDRQPLEGRSGKLARLDELVEAVFAAGERVLVFTHFARWGERLAAHLSERTGVPVACYHGGLSRSVRDRLVQEFQEGTGPGALVLSIKAGGAGLNLTAASHVVLYDRWWNPAVEDQARDRAWRIGQGRTVVSHRLVCPGTVDERVEQVVAGKREIADLVLPASSSLGDLDPDQLRAALGLRLDAMVDETPPDPALDAKQTAA